VAQLDGRLHAIEQSWTGGHGLKWG
jgi:hypothetical protein